MAKLTRRGFLTGAAGVTAGAAGAVAMGIGLERATRGGSDGGARIPAVPLGAQPPGLPARQHAWTATLATDPDGNPIPPRYDRLLFFDVRGDPTPAHARLLEAALRTLERRYDWGSSGLLFTVGWGQPYFARTLGLRSPVPPARALSDFEQPAIDDYDLCLHLACDDGERLVAVQEALTGLAPAPGTDGSRGPGAEHPDDSSRDPGAAGTDPRADGPLDLSPALRLRETRTGFVGAGLPAAHQDTAGIPAGRPVSRGAPLFMGFKSSLRGNQASEDDVTIGYGQFAQGTTMQASYMRLALEDWYGQLDQDERVARMYAPQMTPQQVKHVTTDAPGDPAKFAQAVSRYGVIGHSQTTARVRRNGRPLILRRDFDTIDGGRAGLHFVALQRSIEDFVRTREAMNASAAQLQNPSITDTVNNGINEFIFVLKRGNYLLPARAQRSFPLAPGREQALS
jgi:dye decolorizing peroxidase